MVLAPNRIDVEIEYCAPCEYLPQAVDLTNQLLSDFQGWIGRLHLVPGSGGIFRVVIGGEEVFNNERGGPTFPDVESTRDSFRSRLRALTGQQVIG